MRFRVILFSCLLFNTNCLCFRLLSSFVTEDLEDVCDSVANNEIAVEAISEKLSEVTSLAEELDQALHSAQQDCLVLTTSTSTSTTTLTEPTTSFRRIMETNPTENEVSRVNYYYELSRCVWFCNIYINIF